MRFKKKGMWSVIVSALLVIAVLVAVSFVFTNVTWRGVKDLLGLGFGDEDTSKYVYGGCVPAVCSTQALTCAINSMGLGEEAWLTKDKYDLCPGIEEAIITKEQLKRAAIPTAEEADAAFKDYNQVPSTGAAVTGFAAKTGSDQKEQDLPKIVLPNSEAEAIKFLSNSVIDCWSLFKRNSFGNVHCSKVTVPDNFKGQISNKEFWKELCKQGPTGDELCGTTEIRQNRNLLSIGWSKLKNFFNLKNYQWEIEDPIKKGSDDFFICGNNGGATGRSKIMITRDLSECPNAFSPSEAIAGCDGVVYGGIVCLECKTDDKKFKCGVEGFELPQQVTNKEEWLIDYGDPMYLVYYQKFPKGEEKAWVAQTKTLFMIGIGVRLTFTLIPIAKAGISKLVKAQRITKITELTSQLSNPGVTGETREAIMEKIFKLVGKTGDDGFLTFVRMLHKGQTSVLATGMADDVAYTVSKIADSLNDGVNIVRTAKGVNIVDEGVREFVEQSGKYTEKAVGILRTDFKSTLKLSGLSDEAAEGAAKSFEKALRAGKATDNIEDIARASLKGAQDSIDNVAEEAIKRGLNGDQMKILKKVGFKNAAKAYFDPNRIEATEKALNKVYGSLGRVKAANPTKYTQTMGELDETMRTVFSGKSGEIIDLFTRQGTATSANKLMNIMANSDDFAKALASSGLISESESIIRSGARSGLEFLKQGAKLTRGCIATAPVLLVGGVTYFYSKDGEEAAKNSLITVGVTNPVGCLKFLRYAYLPTILGTSYILAKEDAKNQKFIPFEANQLGILQPMEYVGDKNKLTYDLKTGDSYVALQREVLKPSRLFFASPCKTDLELYTGYISCDLSDNSFVYEYQDTKGKRFIPIEPPKELFKEGDIGVYYSWDKAKDKERVEKLEDRFDFGTPWYAQINIFDTPDDMEKEFNQFTMIYNVVDSNPNYLRTALKFIYGAYPDSDNQARFFYSITRLHGNEKESILPICVDGVEQQAREFEERRNNEPVSAYADSAKIAKLITGDQNTPYSPGVTFWTAKSKLDPKIYEKASEKSNNFIVNVAYVLELDDYQRIRNSLTSSSKGFFSDSSYEDFRNQLKNDKKKVSFKRAECYAELIDKMVNFTFNAEINDSFTFDFTCKSNGRSLSADGWLVHSIVNNLKGACSTEYMTNTYYCTKTGEEKFQCGIFNIGYSEDYAEFQKYTSEIPITEQLKRQPNRQIYSGWDDPDNFGKFVKEVEQLSVSEYDKDGIYLSGFADYVIKQAFHKVLIYKKDITKATRECVNAENKLMPTLDSDEKVIRLALKTSIPTISVRAIGIEDKYKDWNDGINYCYNDVSYGVKMTSNVLNAVSIVGGLALSFAGGGPSGLYAAWVATDLVAIATDYVLEMCGAWPDHKAAFSIKQCFGIGV